MSRLDPSWLGVWEVTGSGRYGGTHMIVSYDTNQNMTYVLDPKKNQKWELRPHPEDSTCATWRYTGSHEIKNYHGQLISFDNRVEWTDVKKYRRVDNWEKSNITIDECLYKYSKNVNNINNKSSNNNSNRYPQKSRSDKSNNWRRLEDLNNSNNNTSKKMYNTSDMKTGLIEIKHLSNNNNRRNNNNYKSKYQKKNERSTRNNNNSNNNSNSSLRYPNTPYNSLASISYNAQRHNEIIYDNINEENYGYEIPDFLNDIKNAQTNKEKREIISDILSEMVDYYVNRTEYAESVYNRITHNFSTNDLINLLANEKEVEMIVLQYEREEKSIRKNPMRHDNNKPKNKRRNRNSDMNRNRSHSSHNNKPNSNYNDLTSQGLRILTAKRRSVPRNVSRSSHESYDSNREYRHKPQNSHRHRIDNNKSHSSSSITKTNNHSHSDIHSSPKILTKPNNNRYSIEPPEPISKPPRHHQQIHHNNNRGHRGRRDRRGGRNERSNRGRSRYLEHINPKEIKYSLAQGYIYKGQLSISRWNPSRSYVMVDGVKNDIRIFGLVDRNRAYHNDTVLVSLYPTIEWSAATTVAMQEFESNMNAEMEANSGTETETETEEQNPDESIIDMSSDIEINSITDDKDEFSTDVTINSETEIETEQIITETETETENENESQNINKKDKTKMQQMFQQITHETETEFETENEFHTNIDNIILPESSIEDSTTQPTIIDKETITTLTEIETETETETDTGISTDTTNPHAINTYSTIEIINSEPKEEKTNSTIMNEEDGYLSGFDGDNLEEEVIDMEAKISKSPLKEPMNENEIETQSNIPAIIKDTLLLKAKEEKEQNTYKRDESKTKRRRHPEIDLNDRNSVSFYEWHKRTYEIAMERSFSDDRPLTVVEADKLKPNYVGPDDYDGYVARGKVVGIVARSHFASSVVGYIQPRYFGNGSNKHLDRTWSFFIPLDKRMTKALWNIGREANNNIYDLLMEHEKFELALPEEPLFEKRYKPTLVYRRKDNNSNNSESNIEENSNSNSDLIKLNRIVNPGPNTNGHNNPIRQHFRDLIVEMNYEDIWKTHNLYPTCHFKKEIGGRGDPEVETKIILSNNHIRHTIQFEPNVEEFVKNMNITETDYNDRLDIRDLPVFTIDPTTARDFDDALSVVKLDGKFDSEGGQLYRIGVHIADVTHFVKPRTPLDDEARERCTSVYLVDRCLPMLPHHLSQNLCSLNPNVDRLAFSVFVNMNEYGKVVEDEKEESPWFGRTVVNSKARLNYETAHKMLEGTITEDTPLELLDKCVSIGKNVILKSVVQWVKLLWKIAEPRRQRRFREGSVEFHRPKIRFRLDNEEKRALFFGPEFTLKSNQLIEEYMLMANELVAAFLVANVRPYAVIRKHPPPDMSTEKVRRLLLIAKSQNISLDFSSSMKFNNSIQKLKGIKFGNNDIEAEDVLNSLLTTPMQRAQYICVGDKKNKDLRHWALNFSIYTHFTSPIRRYADVMVHRLLTYVLYNTRENETQQYIGGEKNFEELPEQMDMEQMCDRCNQLTQDATNASLDSERVHLCLLLQHNPLEMDAVITDLKRFGVSCVLPKLGMIVDVKISYITKENMADATVLGAMPDSTFNITWNNGTKETYKLFDKIRVKLSSSVKTPIELIAMPVPPSKRKALDEDKIIHKSGKPIDKTKTETEIEEKEKESNDTIETQPIIKKQNNPLVLDYETFMSTGKDDYSFQYVD